MNSNGNSLFNKCCKQLSKGLWPDGELTSINIDYDSVTIRIEDSPGQLKRIICQGYIGYEATGHWDESIIQQIKMYESHELIKSSMDAVQGTKMVICY